MQKLLFLCLTLILLASPLRAQPADQSLPDRFRDPPLQYKSRPLWFWNKPNPTTAEIHEQMQKSRDESGYYGFGILPCVEPEKYLTDAYFAHYGDALKKAAELGMKMCLYDEYWFPSGSAGGLFQKNFPDLCMKTLVMKAEDVDGPKLYTTPIPDGTLMAAVAMNNATKERVNITAFVNSKRELNFQAPAGSWKVMAFVCAKTKLNLMDYLNPLAVAKFIEITHEAYFKRFPQHFGTTIDSAFYDEPPLYRANTWTDGFNLQFQKKFGQNPALLYPALFLDIGPDTASARNAMFGLRAELFATQYIKAMNDWCRDHKIRLTGHMDQEQVVNPTGICGDLLKAFQHQDIPGIDEIFSFGRTQCAYKLISSSAYNWDKPLVMSETYGAIKNMPLDMLYRMSMDEYAKGINLLVPHAVWLDEKHIMFEPELSYRHPRYGPALAEFNKYVGRLNLLLQDGRHVADIAVLYPIATLHAGFQFGVGNPYEGGPAVPEADYMDVGERLSLDIRHDFTFIHPEVLDEKCTINGNSIKLKNKVNFEQYKVLIMPGARVIHAASIEKIRQFFDAGGTVIATTRLPSQSAEPGRDQVVRDAVRHIFGAETSAPKPNFKATASSTFGPGFEADKAADGQLSTRWNSSDKASGEQWLELDLGQPTSLSRLIIREAFGRVSKYSLQAWDAPASRWNTIAAGERIGPRKAHDITLIVASRVRLLVYAYDTNCFSIAEFSVNGATADEPAIRTNAAGGQAIFLPSPEPDALKAALDKVAGVYDVEFDKPLAVKDGNLTYIHKVHDGRDIYFFANSSATAVQTDVRLRGRLTLESWNPHTGARAPLPSTAVQRKDQPVTAFNLSLPPGRSVFVIGTRGGE